MSYDYQIEIEGKKIGYQRLLKLLEMENETIMGRPLKDGGAPQVAKFCQTLRASFSDVKAYFNGNQIF